MQVLARLGCKVIRQIRFSVFGVGDTSCAGVVYVQQLVAP